MSKMGEYNPHAGNLGWSVYLVRSVESYPNGQRSERSKEKLEEEVRCTRGEKGQQPSISISECPFLLKQIASFGYPD